MAEIRLTDAAKYDLWETYPHYAVEADIDVSDRVRGDFSKKWSFFPPTTSSELLA